MNCLCFSVSKALKTRNVGKIVFKGGCSKFCRFIFCLNYFFRKKFRISVRIFVLVKGALLAFSHFARGVLRIAKCLCFKEICVHKKPPTLALVLLQHHPSLPMPLATYLIYRLPALITANNQQSICRAVCLLKTLTLKTNICSFR